MSNMLRNTAQRRNTYEERDTPSSPLLSSASDGANRKDESRSYTRLLVKIYIIVLCVNIGVQMLVPAQTQIFEAIYCSQWYKNHPTPGVPSGSDIPESYCKIAPVQKQISTLKGWLEFFMAAPGLLMSIPMGILTDKIGRRRLIIINLTIFFLTQAWTTFITWFGGQIPLRTIWLGASLNLLSGGMIVTELLYVVRPAGWDMTVWAFAYCC